MAEVEAHAVPIAVFERNRLGPWRLLAHVTQRIHMGSDVVADDNHVVRSQRSSTPYFAAPMRWQNPAMFHTSREPGAPPGKRNHLVVNGHA